LVSKANGFTLVQDKVKSPVYASPKISGLSGDSILISTGNNLLCLKPANLQPIWQYGKFEHYNWDTNNNLLSIKSKKRNLIALAVVPAPSIIPARTYPRFWEETSPEIAKKYVQGRNHHKRKVVTLDAASGKELWSKELICLEWLYSDDTGKIFAVSHKGLMLCLDADSGKDIWLYENPPMRKRKHRRRAQV
jgi:outer membrane protein assembly factor BamB